MVASKLASVHSLEPRNRGSVEALLPQRASSFLVPTSAGFRRYDELFRNRIVHLDASDRGPEDRSHSISVYRTGEFRPITSLLRRRPDGSSYQVRTYHESSLLIFVSNAVGTVALQAASIQGEQAGRVDGILNWADPGKENVIVRLQGRDAPLLTFDKAFTTGTFTPYANGPVGWLLNAEESQAEFEKRAHVPNELAA